MRCHERSSMIMIWCQNNINLHLSQWSQLITKTALEKKQNKFLQKYIAKLKVRVRNCFKHVFSPLIQNNPDITSTTQSASDSFVNKTKQIRVINMIVYLCILPLISSGLNWITLATELMGQFQVLRIVWKVQLIVFRNGLE